MKKLISVDDWIKAGSKPEKSDLIKARIRNQRHRWAWGVDYKDNSKQKDPPAFKPIGCQCLNHPRKNDFYMSTL